MGDPQPYRNWGALSPIQPPSQDCRSISFLPHPRHGKSRPQWLLSRGGQLMGQGYQALPGARAQTPRPGQLSPREEGPGEQGASGQPAPDESHCQHWPHIPPPEGQRAAPVLVSPGFSPPGGWGPEMGPAALP